MNGIEQKNHLQVDQISLTGDEMWEHLKKKDFRLGFVGMSNIGKSNKSRRLQSDLKFTHHEVDEKIYRELGYSSMKELADAMNLGKVRQDQYLALENRFTFELANKKNQENLVFDTTGSVIYLKPEVQSSLKDHCLLVNIVLKDEQIPKMVNMFVETVKPVIWGNIEKPDLNDLIDLEKQYRKLLKYRLEQYRNLAHVSIPVGELWDKFGKDILEIIGGALDELKK